MNLLIIGGLFALALVALILLVVIIRADGSSARPEPKAVPKTTGTSRDTAVRAASRSAVDVPNQSAQAPASIPMPRDIPAYKDEQRFPLANGQFRELSSELHTLHEQAQEIEHRLGVLTEMVERIERVQQGHTSIEEEASNPNSLPIE